MSVIYFPFRCICNWFLYSHANILKSFHLILKYRDMGQSSVILFQNKSDPQIKKEPLRRRLLYFYQMLWPFAQVLVCKISFSLMLQFSRKLPYTPEPTELWSSALDIVQSINNDCWNLLNTSVNKRVLRSTSSGCQPLPVLPGTAAAMGQQEDLAATLGEMDLWISLKKNSSSGCPHLHGSLNTGFTLVLHCELSLSRTKEIILILINDFIIFCSLTKPHINSMS